MLVLLTVQGGLVLNLNKHLSPLIVWYGILVLGAEETTPLESRELGLNKSQASQVLRIIALIPTPLWLAGFVVTW